MLRYVKFHDLCYMHIKFLEVLFKGYRMSKRIGVVYFVYINPSKNWKKLILGQLTDFKNTGILNDAFLHVCVSNPQNTQGVSDFFENLDIDIYDIEYNIENCYEYYGLHKVWELAQSDKYDFLAYFHTKGMSYRNLFNFGFGNGRNIREIILTYLTFKKYKYTLEIFDNHMNIQKIGAFPKKDDDSSNISGCFIWFNFFWLRSSYAKTLEEPQKTDNRFYYENWCSKDNGERGDAYKELCYSLYSDSNDGYTIHEATETLKRLKKKYKYLWPISAIYKKLTLR